LYINLAINFHTYGKEHLAVSIVTDHTAGAKFSKLS